MTTPQIWLRSLKFSGALSRSSTMSYHTKNNVSFARLLQTNAARTGFIKIRMINQILTDTNRQVILSWNRSSFHPYWHDNTTTKIISIGFTHIWWSTLYFTYQLSSTSVILRQFFKLSVRLSIWRLQLQIKKQN